MANTHTPSRQRRAAQHGSNGKLWMSERQLDAYLQTRDTLRRLRAAASLTSDIRRAPPPPSSAS
jgi:hypothetical protein